MNCKIKKLFSMIIILACIIPTNIFADSKHKTIVIDLNRSNLSDF
ncbi:hypothetical protein Q5M85_22635 [Paraclostridium bifermentans]|nr:hypothetical protein [Paraclostridium bifermentans]